MGVSLATRRMGLMDDSRPLIVHVIHHLVVGGMENGLVNLVNLLPANRYRHAIVCADDYSDFRHRIRDPDVSVYAMHKERLSQWQVYRKLFDLFRRLRPAIVHSRGRSGLDSLLPALIAGVPVRLHGEHGLDIDNIDGRNRKLRNQRRLHRPLVSRYVCVSKHLARYLIQQVGVAPEAITQIYNGVDTVRFKPRAQTGRRPVATYWGSSPRFVIGTMGRLQQIKNQRSLLDAVLLLLERYPDARNHIGVAIIGEGPERAQLEAYVNAAGLQDVVAMLGARDDVAELLADFDVFVLPSLAEGISNAILEAMACGVPVIASAVGGNVELVEDGRSGRLVPSRDDARLMSAIYEMYNAREFSAACGTNARARAESSFSLRSMVDAYDALYSTMLQSKRKPIDAPVY
ncbi:MAG: TIGR03088 family PEP-CTERM/XrtA system glycosyltransferase [bacterium]